VKVQKKTVARRWLRRLFDMKAKRIAYVHYGANHRVFAVVKEDTRMPLHKGLTLENIEKAHNLLGELVTVFKGGEMDDTAATAVAGRLDVIADLIMPDVGEQATLSMQDLSVSLVKDIENLSRQAIATDYTLGDQVDSILEVAKQLEQQIQGVATMEAAPPIAEPVVEPVVPVETPVEPAAVEPEAIAAAPQAPEPTETQSSDQPEEPEVEASEEAGEPEVEAATGDTIDEPDGEEPTEPEEVVTKAWVTETLTTALAKALEPLLQKLSVAKAVMPVAPVTSPAATLRPPPAPAEPQMRHDAMESMDLTQSKDLERLDDYGRFKD
jgi:hypothetical protein